MRVSEGISGVVRAIGKKSPPINVYGNTSLYIYIYIYMYIYYVCVCVC